MMSTKFGKFLPCLFSLVHIKLAWQKQASTSRYQNTNQNINGVFFSLPLVGVRSIGMSVSLCLSVCLSVCLCTRMSQKRRVQTSRNFAVHVTYGRGSVLLSCVLPVLWMTSCFCIMRQIQIQGCSLRCSELLTMTHQVALLYCAPDAEVCYHCLPVCYCCQHLLSWSGHVMTFLSL